MPGATPTPETPSHARARTCVDQDSTRNELHRHQDLHRIKPDYIDSNINIKLYDYINLRQDIVELYIANINIVKVYINVVFRRCRQKNPAAAMIFDRRSRLRQDPPPS
jgi:hypothetical protein